MKEVAHTLVLPAMVEADPARTVKVLPAVAGRITGLKVRLGERVAKDQELLVIDSGDLAQAYSDRDKARAQLILAKKAMDRLVLYNDRLGKGGVVVDERRKMHAASNQSRHVDRKVLSIAGKSDTQNASAAWAHLGHPRNVRNYLWNWSHNASNSPQCSSTQRRACL